MKALAACLMGIVLVGCGLDPTYRACSNQYPKPASLNVASVFGALGVLVAYGSDPAISQRDTAIDQCIADKRAAAVTNP